MSGTISNNSSANTTPTTPTTPIGAAERPVAPPPETHFETDLSSVLAFAPRDVPLTVLQIADDRARAYCAQFGLAAGDRITRYDGSKDDVLLSMPDGRRIRVGLPVALLIEVQPALPS